MNKSIHITPVKVGDYDIAFLKIGKYQDGGSMSVQAFTSEGEPALTVSVNVPEFNHLLDDEEFFLKAYSENVESVAALVRAGIIEINTEKQTITNGFVTIPIARLGRDLPLLQN